MELFYSITSCRFFIAYLPGIGSLRKKRQKNFVSITARIWFCYKGNITCKKFMSCRFVNFIGCLGGQELMERKLGETNWEIGTAGWANG